jgi:tRNA (guanine-N7-)-methyltransferase
VQCNSEYLDLSEVFPRPAPLVLEIGFGNGESLAEMAQARPHENFIGIDVHLPGIGQLLADIETRGLSNTRVICGDAVEFMSQCLPDCTLTRIQLFFPDPWPKRRHRKRRIVQRAWVSLAARKLQPNGILHMATDWEDYAVEMLRIMESEPQFENIAADRFIHRLNDRPITRYERRGLTLGHGVWEIACRRTAASHSHQDVPLGSLPR